MPRNGSGIYSPPSGTFATPQTEIESAAYNAFVNDLTADANLARPVVAGGTGANTVVGARSNLGIPNVFNTYANLLADGTEWAVGTLLSTRDGLNFEVAATGATDHHATMAAPGLRKIYENGPFTTAERFEQAIARGWTLPVGQTVTVGGARYVRTSGATEHPNLTGWLRVRDVTTSNRYATPRITQSASLPLIQLQNGAAGGGDSTARIQGMDYDHIAREWFTIHSLGGSPEVTVVTRMNNDGTRISTSAETTLLGHGQDLCSFYNASGTRKFITQAANSNQATMFEYLATAAPQSVALLTLFTDSTYTTVNATHDKSRLIALGAHGDVFKIRLWDMSQLTGAGNYSSSYIHEVEIERDPFFTASTNPAQSITADGEVIYIVSGNATTTDPKYLSAYELATGRLIARSEITARRDFATSQNSGAGTEYEMEGTTWWLSGDGFVLAQAVAMDQPTTSSGARNYAMLMRLGPWADFTANGDRPPSGVGVALAGGPADIGMASGQRITFARLGSETVAPSVTEVGYIPGATDNLVWLKPVQSTVGFSNYYGTIADDTAVVIPLPTGGGGSATVTICSGVNGVRYPSGVFKARGSGGAFATPIAMQDAASFGTAPANVTFTTGTILTGTTGTDGNTTISAHSNGNLYIENRTGTNYTVSVHMVGAGL